MTSDWLPEHYLKFADERSRPARDLLAQMPLQNPRVIYDLGCGPGNSTAFLDTTFPVTEIIGIDSSETMLAKARVTLPKRQFFKANLVQWIPPKTADLLFSNAAFQWVPNHAAVMLRLLQGLHTGGVLAVQMPDNLDEPSHRLMRETAQTGPWADKLHDAVGAREGLLTPRRYHDLLKPFSSRLDIWHTIYNHVLDGAQGIVDFVSSTGLRPFIDLLDATQRDDFVKAYLAKIEHAYPVTRDGKVHLRFPRLFLVAQA
jgi:trans-aconitate 2-methyltransferase